MSDTPASSDPITLLRTINATAAFNRWCGIEVLSAGEGKAEIAKPWRANAGQYAGTLAPKENKLLYLGMYRSDKDTSGTEVRLNVKYWSEK